MITSKIEQLHTTIELAIEALKPTSSQQLRPGNWKIVYQEVEVQIVADNSVNPDFPSLILYFVLFELPKENRGACLEELMQAHFHGLSKYALFQDFLMQIMDFPHTDNLTVDHIKEAIELYTKHIAAMRIDLYQRHFAE